MPEAFNGDIMRARRPATPSPSIGGIHVTYGCAALTRSLRIG